MTAIGLILSALAMIPILGMFVSLALLGGEMRREEQRVRSRITRGGPYPG